MISDNDAQQLPGTAANFLWLAILALAGLGGSLVISCVTPFVALAVALAGTVRLTVALRAMIAVWLTNQFVGFAFLHFPRTLRHVSLGRRGWRGRAFVDSGCVDRAQARGVVADPGSNWSGVFLRLPDLRSESFRRRSLPGRKGNFFACDCHANWSGQSCLACWSRRS